MNERNVPQQPSEDLFGNVTSPSSADFDPHAIGAHVSKAMEGRHYMPPEPRITDANEPYVVVGVQRSTEVFIDTSASDELQDATPETPSTIQRNI